MYLKPIVVSVPQVDYQWPSFLHHVHDFVAQVSSPSALCELLAALRPGSVTAPGGMYAGLPTALQCAPSSSQRGAAADSAASALPGPTALSSAATKAALAGIHAGKPTGIGEDPSAALALGLGASPAAVAAAGAAAGSSGVGGDTGVTPLAEKVNAVCRALRAAVTGLDMDRYLIVMVMSHAK